MQALELDKVHVGTVNSRKRGRHHEITVTLEIGDPDRVGDELDDAGSEIASIRFMGAQGEVLAEFLGHVEAVDLKTPASRPKFLSVKVKALRNHTSPAKLRRLAGCEVRLWLCLLSKEARHRALMEASQPIEPRVQ